MVGTELLHEQQHLLDLLSIVFREVPVSSIVAEISPSSNLLLHKRSVYTDLC